MENLKPCPFCREPEELELIFTETRYLEYKAVKCQRCFTTGPKSVNSEFALMWWNKRATQ